MTNMQFLIAIYVAIVVLGFSLELRDFPFYVKSKQYGKIVWLWFLILIWPLAAAVAIIICSWSNEPKKEEKQ